MAKIKNTDHTMYWQGCRETGTLPVGLSNCAATLGNSLSAFKKINIDLPHVSAFPLLNIYPREYKHIS